jgi:ATPase subunit of ABC transporter with duplicated ATPase domains
VHWKYAPALLVPWPVFPCRTHAYTRSFVGEDSDKDKAAAAAAAEAEVGNAEGVAATAPVRRKVVKKKGRGRRGKRDDSSDEEDADTPAPAAAAPTSVAAAAPAAPVSLLFRNVEMSIGSKSRVVLLGENGNGKTTLVKLMLGQLEPTSGEVFNNPNARHALVNQHHGDQLDLSKSPLQVLTVTRSTHDTRARHYTSTSCTTPAHHALHQHIMHYARASCTTPAHHALHQHIMHYTSTSCTTPAHHALHQHIMHS